MNTPARTLRWVTLWPVIVFLFHCFTWLIPPVGFVMWRMRVSKRRHRALVGAVKAGRS